MATAAPTPTCYFCRAEVTEDDYCAGCDHYVCTGCNEADPWGNHEVDAHLNQLEEEEEDDA